MFSGAFSPVHILVVLTVALIVLGPTELPKVARTGARALRELRALRARLDEELHVLLDDEPDPAPPPTYDDPPPPAPPAASSNGAPEPNPHPQPPTAP